MKRKLAHAVLAAVMAGGMAVGAAGPASAAHCTGTTDEEKAQPGFSYFGQDGREENDKPPGASVCRKNTGSPSKRAPGQS